MDLWRKEVYYNFSMKYYTLKICGFERRLPIIKIGSRLAVASFSLLGDVELVDVLAAELVERIKYLDFDYLIATEVKVLPLVYQMSRLLGSKHYIVVRKKILSYMTQSIKSDGHYPLVLNGKDAQLLREKKVILIDDVVATGKTMKEIENLMGKAGAKIVATACVLKQGDLQVKIDQPIFYLEQLPFFERSKG